jgi:hypothetical protein
MNSSVHGSPESFLRSVCARIFEKFHSPGAKIRSFPIRREVIQETRKKSAQTSTSSSLCLASSSSTDISVPSQNLPGNSSSSLSGPRQSISMRSSATPQARKSSLRSQQPRKRSNNFVQSNNDMASTSSSRVSESGVVFPEVTASSSNAQHIESHPKKVSFAPANLSCQGSISGAAISSNSSISSVVRLSSSSAKVSVVDPSSLSSGVVSSSAGFLSSSSTSSPSTLSSTSSTAVPSNSSPSAFPSSESILSTVTEGKLDLEKRKQLLLALQKEIKLLEEAAQPSPQISPDPSDEDEDMNQKLIADFTTGSDIVLPEHISSTSKDDNSASTNLKAKNVIFFECFISYCKIRV